MYSRPRGSIRKNGPSPKRSFSGTGRSRRTCMRCPGEAIIERLLESMMAGARRHAGAVLVAAAVLTGLGVLLVTRITFDANILRLLPQRSPAVQSFRTFL